MFVVLGRFLSRRRAIAQQYEVFAALHSCACRKGLLIQNSRDLQKSGWQRGRGIAHALTGLRERRAAEKLSPFAGCRPCALRNSDIGAANSRRLSELKQTEATLPEFRGESERGMLVAIDPMSSTRANGRRRSNKE